MFDRIFAAAFIDGGLRTKVLGVKLLPFSCWHLFLLQVIDSPFVNAGEVQLYHLRRAIGICRLRYPDSRTRLPFSLRVINRKILERDVVKFLRHIASYLQKPDYTVIPFDEFGKQPPPRMMHKTPNPPPDIISLVFDAARGANVGLDEAWNMPIGQAYVAQAMYYHHQGLLVDFMNEDEREFQEKLRASLKPNATGTP